MHLLYLNGETFHDCVDMDDKNIHFSNIIKVNLIFYYLLLNNYFSIK
jgi:hypothetical protein